MRRFFKVQNILQQLVRWFLRTHFSYSITHFHNTAIRKNLISLANILQQKISFFYTNCAICEATHARVEQRHLLSSGEFNPIVGGIWRRQYNVHSWLVAYPKYYVNDAQLFVNTTLELQPDATYVSQLNWYSNLEG